MSRLEEIFEITNVKKRQEELISFAKSLNLNFEAAKKPDGSYDENILAVAIHDETKTRIIKKSSNIGMILGIIFVILMISAAFLLIKNYKGANFTF